MIMMITVMMTLICVDEKEMYVRVITQIHKLRLLLEQGYIIVSKQCRQ
jgi:hypothetical protein